MLLRKQMDANKLQLQHFDSGGSLKSQIHVLGLRRAWLIVLKLLC
jgi:hypothetical protein